MHIQPSNCLIVYNRRLTEPRLCERAPARKTVPSQTGLLNRSCDGYWSRHYAGNGAFIVGKLPLVVIWELFSSLETVLVELGSTFRCEETGVVKWLLGTLMRDRNLTGV
jgi:hypothetical protein